MKMKIITFLVLALNFNLVAQIKNHFIDTGKRWWIIYNCQGPCGALDKYRSYYFDTDTIIESKQYKILKAIVTKSMPLDLPVGFIYNVGYFREDTILKKVFTYFFGNSIYNIKNRDILLYDFELKVGDSLSTYSPCSDSMITLNLIRKEIIDTLTFNNINKFVFRDNISYDEITSSIYLPTIFDTMIRCSFFIPFIQCAKIGDFNIFGTKCNEVKSSNPINDELFKVYPNPFVENLMIDVSNVNNTVISIYSLDNKLMAKIKIKSKNTMISNIDLQKGVYIYNIMENNKILKLGKLIKI
jgi:hypothetical protein